MKLIETGKCSGCKYNNCKVKEDECLVKEIDFDEEVIDSWKNVNCFCKEK